MPRRCRDYVVGLNPGGHVHSCTRRLWPTAWWLAAALMLALAAERIVNDQVGGEPIAVFTAAGMLSALDAEIIKDSRRIPAAAGYSRVLGAHRLSFELRGERIFDRETGSEWDIFGRALDGPLKGERLQPVDGGVHFAFAWLAFHPGSEVYRSAAARNR